MNMLIKPFFFFFFFFFLELYEMSVTGEYGFSAGNKCIAIKSGTWHSFLGSHKIQERNASKMLSAFADLDGNY